MKSVKRIICFIRGWLNFVIFFVAEIADDRVEGGIYISPEFQLGQVYDGTCESGGGDDIILYRPVYVCIPHDRITVTNTNNAHTSHHHHHMKPAQPSSSKPKPSPPEEETTGFAQAIECEGDLTAELVDHKLCLEDKLDDGKVTVELTSEKMTSV